MVEHAGWSISVVSTEDVLLLPFGGEKQERESASAGCVVFHRSGDAVVGTHGNSGLWRPSSNSHRIVLVLYQTDLKTS